VEDETGLIPVPILSNSAIMWSAVLFLGLLISAISLEMLRQNIAQRRRIRGFWRSAEDIAQDKELSDNEWRALRALLQHRSPKDPLRIIAERHPFDTAVGDELADLLRRGKKDRYAELGVILRDVRGRLAHDYIPLGQRIHSTRELFNNQRIWIADIGESPPNWIEMKTIAVDEAYLTLGRPDPEGPLPEFKPGATVRCRMWRDDDARYLFDLKCDQPNAELPGINFYHGTGLERVQARQYFRVRHDQTTDISIINKPVDDAEDVDLMSRPAVTKLRGRITNVSAGGFAAVVHQPVSKQVFLRTTLDLEESEPLTVVCKIVAIIEMAGGRHLLRTQFVGLDPEDRERVAKHVTIKQQHFEESHAG
jgi:c-di-GMP-binding flagellar brake protein YcgR